MKNYTATNNKWDNDDWHPEPRKESAEGWLILYLFCSGIAINLSMLINSVYYLFKLTQQI